MATNLTYKLIYACFIALHMLKIKSVISGVQTKGLLYQLYDVFLIYDMKI